MGSSIRADYTSDRHANATYVAFAEPHVTSCFLRYACAHTHAPREATMGCRLGHQLRKRCSSTRSFHRTLRGLAAHSCFPMHATVARGVPCTHAACTGMLAAGGGGHMCPGAAPRATRRPGARSAACRSRAAQAADPGAAIRASRLLRRTMRMPALTR